MPIRQWNRYYKPLVVNLTRASTNFQNQEVQDFQPSKFGSEANETWTMKIKSAFFSGFKRSYK